MIMFNPGWGGLDYVQDTPPADSFAITFLPSIIGDALAGYPQMEAEESVHSFMQSQFRASTENMYGAGLVVSAQA